MNPEIASVGEDGRLVCFRIEENQNDIAGMLKGGGVEAGECLWCRELS